MPHSAWGEQISGDSHCLLQTGPWDLSPVWGRGAEGNGWDVGWLLGGADGGNWGLGGAVTPTGWWGWGWGAVSGAALPTDRLHKREQRAGSSHCGQRGRMPSIAGNVGGARLEAPHGDTPPPPPGSPMGRAVLPAQGSAAPPWAHFQTLLVAAALVGFRLISVLGAAAGTRLVVGVPNPGVAAPHLLTVSSPQHLRPCRAVAV